jgi:hypothetical protein
MPYWLLISFPLRLYGSMVRTPYSNNFLPSHESCIDLWNEFLHAFVVDMLPLYALSNKRAISDCFGAVAG